MAFENFEEPKGRANNEMSVERLTDWLKGETIIIPPWQRELAWPQYMRQVYVSSVIDNDPTPQILLRKVDMQWSLEDGRQRLTALLDFRDGVLTDKTRRKFDDLSADEKNKFLKYRIPVQSYWGYSNKVAIEFFMRYQEGKALSVGEKYHAVNDWSPLVKMTKELLMTAGTGFHDRAETIWGRRCDEINSNGEITDNKRQWLASACAMIGGLAWGPDRITKSWNEINTPDTSMSMLTMSLHGSGETEDQVKAKIMSKLNMIFSIYEQVQHRYPVNMTKCKKQFDPGFATGYIIFSMSNPSIPDDFFKEQWVKFLVRERKLDAPYRKPTLQSEEVVGECRNWSLERWKRGHNYVFKDTIYVVPTVPTVPIVQSPAFSSASSSPVEIGNRPLFPEILSLVDAEKRCHARRCIVSTEDWFNKDSGLPSGGFKSKILLESQCPKDAKSHHLCTSCSEKKEKGWVKGKGDWHGLIGGSVPKESHVVGGEWAKKQYDTMWGVISPDSE